MKIVQRTSTGLHALPTRFRLPTSVASLKPIEGILFLLPLFSLVLWSLSLKDIDIQHMNDLGLVSVFPPSIFFALGITTISFCLALQQQRPLVPILLLHLLIMVFMLYGVTILIEQAPRFSTVYRHVGYTEFIMRTGTVQPTLDTYFSWPGFFILSAFVTQVVGYHDVLGIALWSPIYFNLLYLGALYVILTTITTDIRLMWLSLWFFVLSNWIAQDYFSPQGLNFFIYMVIVAIVLKWFNQSPNAPSLLTVSWLRRTRFSPRLAKLYRWLTMPDKPGILLQTRQRVALLGALLLIFLFSVASHPLTPFFILASITTLIFLRRYGPLWLPFVMAAMTAAWILFMGSAFLVGHMSMITGDLGQISSVVSDNLTNRVTGGSPQHTFITYMRVVMTLILWVGAFVGGICRVRKGYQDATYVLLVLSSFSLIVAQSYGGEIFLRIFLFTLPLMVFFAAAAFYTVPTNHKISWRLTTAIIAISLLLLGGFLFTRYGNERMDYKTYAEIDGVKYLYDVAVPHALLVQAWDNTPWIFQDYEKYDTATLDEAIPDIVTTRDVNAVVQFVKKGNYPAVYLIFTRSQKVYAEMSGEPADGLDRLEKVLLASGKFKLIYENTDAQILKFTAASTNR